jgi:phage-related protein (TIGR01555 family)
MSAALKTLPRKRGEKRGAYVRRMIARGVSDEAILAAEPKANVAKQHKRIQEAADDGAVRVTQHLHAVPPQPRRLQIAPEALGRSRLAPSRDLGIGMTSMPIAPGRGSAAFHVPRPPPGVVPDGVRPMAMDADLGVWSSGLSTWTENLSWLGMPFLAELAQRAEYRQIAETFAKEMTRKWIKVSAIGDDDKTDKIAVIERALKKHQVRNKFRRLAELDCFFGRGHLYVDNGCTSDRDLLKVPLILDRRTFEPGSLLGFRVVEPAWTYPGIYDSIDPMQEDFYCPRTWYVMSKEVHRSRLLTLVSREVPDLLKPSYQFGGISMSQMARPYIDNWLRTRQSVSDLVHSFSTMILSCDMSQVIGDGGGNGQDLFDRIDLFNNLRDNRGTMTLNKDTEELSNVVTPLGTLDHLQAQAQEQMAAVSHIPLIVLLGITPSGLNASSDGELQAWASWVKAMQEHLFDDPLDRVIKIIQIDEFGEIDPAITFDYEPLRELSDAEEAAARKTEADTDALYVNSGVLDPDEIRQRLTSEEGGMYSGIDLSGPAPQPLVPPGMESDPLGGPPGGGGPPDAPGGSPAASATRASAAFGAHDDVAYEHWWNSRPNPEDDIAAAVSRIAEALENRGMGGAAAVIAMPPDDSGGGEVDAGAFDEDLKPVERRQYGSLQIGIETRKGEIRSGNGWSVEMPADYGYIMRTEGADGDRVDVFVGLFEPTQLPAFVIEQYRLDGRSDEHKVLIGFATMDQAIAAYDQSYSDGSGPERRGMVHQMAFVDLRSWLKDHPMPITQSAADYGQGMTDGEHCGVCKHFIAPYGCERVLGSVDSEGWCKLFSETR